MKKNMFLIASIVTASVCGMEITKSNVWTITFGGTKINVHKGDMLDTYADGQKKVDFIAVGHYAQRHKFSFSAFEPFIGKCWKPKEVFFATSNTDNNYSFVSYHIKNGKRKALFPEQKDYNVCIKVGEPQLWEYGIHWCYRPRRQLSNGKSIYQDYEGSDAIKEGLQDLEVCYAKVLAYIAEQNDKQLAKAVALPTLGVEKYTSNVLPKDKAAPIAVKLIIEFIKNNRDAYNCMELFVEEDFEFDLYKELLMHWRGKENVLLLYCAHKDSENICSWLLLDLIHCIARLI